MFTTPMTQIFAVVLEKDSRAVTEALLREGVMQFISVSEFAIEGLKSLSSVKPEVSLTEISDLRKRIEGLLHTIGIIPSPPKDVDLKNRVAVDIEKEKARLDKIDKDRENIRERQRALQQEILKIEDIRRQMQLYDSGLAGMPLPTKQSILSIEAGKMPLANIKQLDDGLKGLPAMSIALAESGGVAHVLVISMKRDSEQISRICTSAGWTKMDLPGELLSRKKNFVEELSAKLTALTDEQKKLQIQADNLVKSQMQDMVELWGNLRVNELCYKIQDYFTSSSRTIIFAGWLPSSKKENLASGITAACHERCYMEWHEAASKDADVEEIPIVLDNPKILAPFQMLVSNFGIPKYGAIDPTPFVMPLYLIMFGLMFADVGQGLILGILGSLGAIFLGKREEKKGMYQLSWLVIWCGISSIIFGALFGSYFGLGLFKPLWFDFHGVVSGHAAGNSVIGDIYDVLLITLYFGIAVILLGLLFNWINIIRSRKWMELVFDKGGILGGWIYAGGVYIAYYLVTHDYKAFPSSSALFLLVELPALLLFVRMPYHHFKHHKAGQNSNPLFAALGWLMEWVVELLEIFSGYLSNTLSFMRVAGLGIAHVSLMVSFFNLADMTSGISSVLILIFGNILVIGLEGLSAGIQALRLNYYEFFTKFFHGTGKLHTPISLTSKL